jgi:hypothetical protein
MKVGRGEFGRWKILQIQLAAAYQKRREQHMIPKNRLFAFTFFYPEEIPIRDIRDLSLSDFNSITSLEDMMMLLLLR